MPVEERKAPGAEPAPPVKPAKAAFKYRPQYGVIVICDGEDDHQKVYNELRDAGYRCRVVSV